MVSILNLPTEVRLEIYHYLFTSTRLTYQSGGRSGTKGTRSSFPAFDILRACRLIHREASPLWLSLVTFEFPDISKFTKTADAALEAGKVEDIKNVAIRGAPVAEITSGDGGCGVDIEQLTSYFKIFSKRGLNLDTLTLFNVYHSPSFTDRDYYDAEEASSVCFLALISLLMSEGWRECKFVSETLDLFMSDEETLHYWLENEEPDEEEKEMDWIDIDESFGQALWAGRLEARFGRRGESKYRRGGGEGATMEVRTTAEGVALARKKLDEDASGMITLLLRLADLIEDKHMKEGFVVVARRGTKADPEF